MNEQRARPVGGLAEEFEEPGLGRYEPHVGRVGLDQDRRGGPLGQRSLDRLAVVPRHHLGVRGLGLRTTYRSSTPNQL